MMGRFRDKLLGWVGIDAGNKPQTEKAMRLKALSNDDSELREWLRPTIDLVEVRDSARLISRKLEDKEERNKQLSSDLESSRARVAELERTREGLQHQREELTRAVGDLSALPEGCLRHELALDTVLSHLPQLSGRLEQNENVGARVRPTRTCNDPAKLESFDLEKWDWTVHTFTAPKSERYELRHSEDRVGFVENQRSCRMVAVDGVGGSSHGRHLAQRLCDSALGRPGKTKDGLHLTLRRFGEEMSELKNGSVGEGKMAFWKDKKNEQGSACVLAVADVDIESGRVSGWQLGDTVVFVEVSETRGASRWKAFPEIDADTFGSRPEQLNSLRPEGVSALSPFTINNATGRVVICTDGMAEHLLKNGIEKVAFGIIKHGDPRGALDRLRRDGIADDDLSMILMCPRGEGL